MGVYADGLVDKYWHLSFTAGPDDDVRRYEISCNRYLMNTAKAKPMQDKIAAVEAVTRGNHKGVYYSRGSFFRATLGKGLPSDMELILEAGVKLGVLPAVQAQVQAWADGALGVDCTGFVSAYHFLCGQMPLNDSPNAGCGYFRTMAVHKNGKNAMVWDFDEVQADDVMLWMTENGTETKKPGHIAMVYGRESGDLLIAESSGANDGKGHSGPRLNRKTWADAVGSGGSRHLPIGEGVIIVRTINAWYAKPNIAAWVT